MILNIFFFLIAGITSEQYRTSVHTSVETDWQCVKCQPTATPLQSFSIPHGDSTHLSDLPSELSSPDSHDESNMDVESFSDILTQLPPELSPLSTDLTDDESSVGEPTSASDTSMPSLDSNIPDSSDSEMDASLSPVEMPNLSIEKSINDSLPLHALPANHPQPEYTIFPAASYCQGDKLTDNLGFSYTVKAGLWGGTVTHWRCSICNRHVNCLATVCQEGDVFIRGPHDHLHPSCWTRNCSITAN